MLRQHATWSEILYDALIFLALFGMITVLGIIIGQYYIARWIG